MQLKEGEFQNLWCPFAKPGVFRKNAAGGIVEDFNCIGEACACCCRDRTTQKGYCGLTGIRSGWNV